MKLSPDDLATPKEVAAHWRISVKTLKRRVATGKLRVAPCMLYPDLRWRRADIARDTEQASYSRDAFPRHRRTA